MKRFILVLFAVLMLMSALVSTSMASKPDPNTGHKVTLCHATGSKTNPYVVITVDVAAGGLKGGHENHSGDVIPPFTYVDKNGVTRSYAGKGSQALLTNGCHTPPAVVTPPPPPVTPPPPPTPTPPPATTTPPPPTPPVVTPPVVTPPVEQTPPPVTASAGNGGEAAAPTETGQAAPTTTPKLQARTTSGQLPYTGVSGESVGILLLIALVALGLGLYLSTRKPDNK